MTNEELIKEALRRYPVGTKFKPAHTDRDAAICIVTNTNFKMSNTGTYIFSLCDDGSTWDSNTMSCYGNTPLDRVVYYDGKWATIIGEEYSLEKQESSKPEGLSVIPDGTEYVVCTNTHSKYTFEINYVFKVCKINRNAIILDLDLSGLKNNGWGKIYFRQATIKEANLYKKHGKPVSIDELNQNAVGIAPKKSEVKKDAKSTYGQIFDTKDLIPGEYYQSDRCGVIIKWSENNHKSIIWNNQTSFTACARWDTSTPFTPLDPNSIEAKWIEKCIAANKFVPKNELVITTKVDSNPCAAAVLRKQVFEAVVNEMKSVKPDPDKSRLSIKLLNDLRSL